MKLTVHFHSYFRELAGVSQASFDLPPDSTLRDLTVKIYEKFPALQPLEKSTLKAVGVEYQRNDHILREGDEISLFPPVQGG